MIPPVIPLILSIVALCISIYFGVITHFYTRAAAASIEEAHAHRRGDRIAADEWHQLATRRRAAAHRWDIHYRWRTR